MSHADWEPVIGLEIHAELNTDSKLFSCAPNRFGEEPNTNIDPVCTGQPGALPVLNKEAVHKAVQLGCALNAEVSKVSKFDRKSYFYPDSPRNFQITQFDEPIIIGGEVTVEVSGEEKTFAIDRVHLEDDAGMLKHFSTFAGVDYNRAGVPLVEIVSKPCLHSPKDAVAYAMAIRGILQYIDVSDCNMEEGSLRFDANISVRKRGEPTLRNKIEIKNMNSFNNLEKALESEIKRQIEVYEKDPEAQIDQATYRFDPQLKETVLMRRKETADDYRYFPEPDLVPIVLTEAYIQKVRSELPELPLQRLRRYIHDYKLKPDSAFVLTNDKPLADYYELALKTAKDPVNLCNWMIVEFPGRLKDKGLSLPKTDILPEELADLVNMIHDGTITGKIAKAVADERVETSDKTIRLIVDSNPDYKPLTDLSAIEPLVDDVLAANPEAIASYKSGKEKAFASLVGQVMKQTRGKASPQIVNDLLRKKIGD